MAIFFTADSHFGHANIIRYCKRPWLQEGDLDEKGYWKNKTIALMRQKEMDRDLIINWNNTVGRKDTVYHLGDFCMGYSAEDFKRYKWQLNGNIIFVQGNHDKAMLKAMDPPPHLRKIGINGQTIILSHFALRVWDKSHFDSWHLYGHSHGTLPGQGKSIDVGVDTSYANYAPISFDKVKEIMLSRPHNDNWVERLRGYTEVENNEEYKKWKESQQE